MCHWSEVAYDYSSKQSIMSDGTITYEKTGAWVLCIETCEKLLEDRR